MYKTILIPLDGSELAEAALPHAVELAQKFGSKIILLRVVQPVNYMLTELGSAEDLTLMKKLYESLKRESMAYLQRQEERLKRDVVEASAILLDGVQPAQTILETADALDADVIIMSTHGRTGVGRWLFGSVAENVVRHSKVPVLSIRAR